MTVQHAKVLNVLDVKPAAARAEQRAARSRTRLRHLTLLQRTARHEQLMGLAPVATDTLGYAFTLAIETAPADTQPEIVMLRDGGLRVEDLSVPAARLMLAALREARGLFMANSPRETGEYCDISVV